MIHLVFDRPSSELKAFTQNGLAMGPFEASGDAWGDGVSGPYGHQYPIAPGHYALTAVDDLIDSENPDGTVAEGPYQVYVDDLDASRLDRLRSANLASGFGPVTIGGITLPVGGLATYGRSEIMIHGGGSNLGVPACYAPQQALCKTEGCTRMHNADLARFAPWIKQQLLHNIIVYSVIGNSPPLDC